MALTERSFENRWDPRASLGELEALAYRSNLLAADRAIVNFGGGNTSVKTREPDHTGRMVNVLWVKGSGSDLATIGPSGFTGLRLDEILPLAERDAMTDQEMVVLSGSLPARPVDAATRRSRRCCMRSCRTRTSTTRTRTRSERSSAAPTASAWRGSASAPMRSGFPTCAPASRSPSSSRRPSPSIPRQRSSCSPSTVS